MMPVDRPLFCLPNVDLVNLTFSCLICTTQYMVIDACDASCESQWKSASFNPYCRAENNYGIFFFFFNKVTVGKSAHIA